MSALILLRHGLTEANARRLYCGWTDLPLSPAGQALCREMRKARPLPDCDAYAASDLARARETLVLLTGRDPELTLPDLREMHFGAFEMRGYEELKGDADYRRWIAQDPFTGAVSCPGGESPAEFRARALRGGAALLQMQGDALAVCHGGAIVQLMAAWFPTEGRNFYEWQPGPCRGYRVEVEDGAPVGFSEI